MHRTGCSLIQLCQLLSDTPTHLCGWRTAGRFSRLSRVYPHLCHLRCVPLGVRVQLGEVEAGDLGEEGPCAALEEVQAGVHSPGLRAKLRYVVLVRP